MNIEHETIDIQPIAQLGPPITEERLSHVTNAVQVLKQDLENILASVTESKLPVLASSNTVTRTTVAREGKGSPSIVKRRALATKTRPRLTNTTRPADLSDSFALENENSLVKPLIKKDLYKMSSGGVSKKVQSPSKISVSANKLLVKKNTKSAPLNTLKRSTTSGTTTSLSRATRSTTSISPDTIRRMR